MAKHSGFSIQATSDAMGTGRDRISGKDPFHSSEAVRLMQILGDSIGFDAARRDHVA